ncbi:tyrosine-type recombinase/integrase [Thauera aromatica]|uniref:tyrosine-type recombinase/integrase n=1 Tax=Thauera aromatica TaxID=59405 RepID=UPI001FFD4E3B|nr:tyrosine-type recombinase/integrase [Thauera aromatica]MCK2086959.1 tyrosine-type recombinase/integrase [Thauera aromatica]
MRPRKTDRHLPSCVYQKHGAFWLVKHGKWIRLGADFSEAMEEYARRMKQKMGGMAQLIEDALPSILKDKAPSTVKKYRTTARFLQEAFADFAPHQVKQSDVAALRRHLIGQATICNRTLSVLRMVFDVALEDCIVDFNPCTGIKTVKQPKRERRVEPWEFDAIKAQAGPLLAVVIDLCYLTGQRIGDVLKIARADLRDEGVYVVQQKTAARVLIRWNPDLRAAVERAKALHKNVAGMYLLGTKPPVYNTIWQQYKKAREAAGIPDVVLHDLRAMSGTEAEAQGADPQKLLEHTDRKMTERYLRDKKITQAEGPSFRQSKTNRG